MLNLTSVQSVEVNGTVLAALEKGGGDPLVLVHGSASDLRTWSHQIDVFPQRFRTIAYSRRFHAPNAPIPSDAPDPIQAHVDDLAALFRAMDAGPAHVVGHSWGALVSLLAAEQVPALFRSLILIEPPAISMHVSIPPTANQLIRLLVSEPRLAFAIMKFGARTVGPSEKAFRRGEDKLAVEIFARGVLGERYFEALSEERFAQVWDNRGPDRALALYQGFPDLRGKTFQNVRVPVFLIGGTDSPPLFKLLLDGLFHCLSDARIKMIENASHIVHEDAPEALNAFILEFLDEVGQGPIAPA